jgi:hypothetical protein
MACFTIGPCWEGLGMLRTTSEGINLPMGWGLATANTAIFAVMAGHLSANMPVIAGRGERS